MSDYKITIFTFLGPLMLFIAYHVKPFPRQWQNILVCYLPVFAWLNLHARPDIVSWWMIGLGNVLMFLTFVALVRLGGPFEQALQRWWDRHFGKQG